jgi:NADPH-dependent glutamate synthase beta subunit-like oxidoreductase
VTVVDRAERPGGRLRLIAQCGPAAELLRSVDWLVERLGELGVKIELGVEADEALLAERAPDAIVLATGARPVPERIAGGDGSIPVVSIDDAMTADQAGRTVLVVDHLGNEEVALAAEWLAQSAAAVTLVTPMQSVGVNVGFTLLRDQIVRLHELGCTLEANTAVTGIEGGTVVTRDVFSGTTERRPFDLVVAGVAGEADVSLRAAAEAVARQVELAGDAVAPRTAMLAFREGDAAGRAIGDGARSHAPEVMR